MKFELTQEQKGVKAAARELAKREIQLEMTRTFDQERDFQALCKKQSNQVSITYLPFDKYGGQR